MIAERTLADWDEDSLMDGAFAAYFRRFGDAADLPSAYCSYVRRGHVVLCNNYRELARFKICAQRLRFTATYNARRWRPS
ncbi:MAG: hypothetical protein SFX73_14075 [Kofleriaceae bacterium]|nr:hypothetical protein [Kofleriaceae bacterium]